MTRISEPKPILKPVEVRAATWPVLSRVALPVFDPLPQDFSAVIESRRSRRCLKTARFRDIISVVSFALRPRYENVSGLARQYRSPTMSAGALRSVEALIVDWRGALRVFRFCLSGHTLEKLEVINKQAAGKFVGHFEKVLPAAGATAIVLVGDVARISSFYENPESLLFRDAGALLQSLAVSSTAFDIGFCPMGILGGELLDALGMKVEEVTPVGVAAIGAISD